MSIGKLSSLVLLVTVGALLILALLLLPFHEGTFDIYIRDVYFVVSKTLLIILLLGDLTAILAVAFFIK